MTPDRRRFVGTVFLDRDGTINRKAPENDYVKTVEEFDFLPNVAGAIRELNQAGFRVIVATNQRGIALGRMTEHDLQAIHDHMLAQLAASGAVIDAIYHCPHDSASCDCRKPNVGMFLRAATEHEGVNLEQSVIFGDSARDMAAGARLGMLRVLVGPDSLHGRAGVGPVDHHAATLHAGVRWFLARDADVARHADARTARTS